MKKNDLIIRTVSHIRIRQGGVYRLYSILDFPAIRITELKKRIAINYIFDMNYFTILYEQ